MRSLLLWTLLLLPLLAQPPAPDRGFWLLELRPARASFDRDASAEEEALVTAHDRRLQRLFREGKVLLAGRCLDVPRGLILVRDATRQDAERLLAEDPCVQAGVFLGRSHPYRPALLAGRDDGLRRPPELDPQLVIETGVEVPLTPAQAYARWNDEAGLRSFFAQSARIGPRPGDPYEIFLLPPGGPGPRGGKGCRRLASIPGRMLSLEWRAPPSLPYVRPFVTTVVLLFEPSKTGCKLTLHHRDFGRGEEWRRMHRYFQRAWPMVLRRFVAPASPRDDR